jgi:hypothetical protein
MIIIDFFKLYNASWEQLKEKAISAIEDYRKSAINHDNGELSVEIQYSDYKQALDLGLKTFIMEVLNDWQGAEEPILIFNDKFYERFSVLELEGVVREAKIPHKFNSSKELFKFFKETKITINVDEFEKISVLFEEAEVIATIISLDYKLFELDEFRNDNLFNGTFDDEDDLEDEY